MPNITKLDRKVAVRRGMRASTTMFRHPDWPTMGRKRENFSRITYKLGFRHLKSKHINESGCGTVNGRMPDSRNDGSTVYNGWTASWNERNMDPVQYALLIAVSECIHEALEWVQLDGKPILDPHGFYESEILTMSRSLCDEFYLMALARSTGQAYWPGTKMCP